MDSANKVQFNTSSLSAGYAQRSSLARYKELKRTFPNTLILFSKNGYYYGFDETAVAMSKLFGCHYQMKKRMLVAKSAKIERMIAIFQSRGLRYIIDVDGKLTFDEGKGFRLQNPLSYYETHQTKKRDAKTKSTSWTDSNSKSYSKHGGGWNDDVWTPGLPSSRFYRTKK